MKGGPGKVSCAMIRSLDFYPQELKQEAGKTNCACLSTNCSRFEIQMCFSFFFPVNLRSPVLLSLLSLSSYICSFCLESYEHRYSHTIFPNTSFKFTMNFFFKNRKEITFEKETNFAPLLLSHQKLHKCRKEWGGGFQKWLHCDICPWCITASVSLRWCTIGRRIEWKNVLPLIYCDVALKIFLPGEYIYIFQEQ